MKEANVDNLSAAIIQTFRKKKTIVACNKTKQEIHHDVGYFDRKFPNAQPDALGESLLLL